MSDCAMSYGFLYPLGTVMMTPKRMVKTLKKNLVDPFVEPASALVYIEPRFA